MSKENESIIVRLNPNYHIGRENYIPSRESELAKLILDRIRKYENFVEKHNFIGEELYDKVKRYDSIHIDGARGAGKSTIIKFLADSSDCDECKELKEKVEFLSIVDPNQLDKDTNIIDIVTDLVYQTVKNVHKNKKGSKDMALFKSFSDLKCEIDKLTFKTYKKDYENANIRSRATSDERQLDYTFHKFADAACKLLNKKALILPLDDIDMRLDMGVTILETIRKYFQTPHLIPVIALDSAQAYALVKKLFYKPFNYKANTPNRAIESDSDMRFLKKLPSEYIQKILPPSQRIALYDMLDYYKEECDETVKNHKPVYFYKELENGSGMEVTLSFKEMLKLIMNVLFDYNDKTDKYSPENYRVVNYLKNKSFRSFLDDARALMRGLSLGHLKFKGMQIKAYKLDTQYLKRRFQLYSRGSASNKYDGALWFWDKYIDRIYAELDKVAKKDDFYKVDYIIADFLNDMLVVDASDTSSLGRKEKIYYRLFIQEFFINSTHVVFKENENGYTEIKQIIKEYNLQGYLEFIMRTLFPASIFEILVNEKILAVLKFPIEQLRDFASPNNKVTLKELYDEWLPFWTELYPQRIKKEDRDNEEEYVIFNPLGIKLEDNNTQPFRKNILMFTTKEDFLAGEQTYFVHPFKVFSFLAEYNPKTATDDFYYKYMPKGYLQYKGGRLNTFKNKIERIFPKTTNVIVSQNIMLGIVDSIEKVQKLTKNILLSLLAKPQEIQKEFYNQLRDVYGLDTNSINILYRIELQKNISGAFAELLNMLVSIFLQQSRYSDKYLSKKKKEHKEELQFNLDLSPIRTAISEQSMLLPYIKDDPLLRNINLIPNSTLSGKSEIMHYLRAFADTSGLNKIYHTGGKQNLIFLHAIENDKSAITRLFDDRKGDFKNAYYKLFLIYIKKQNLDKKIKILLNNKKKISDSFDKKINDLIKKGEVKKEEIKLLKDEKDSAIRNELEKFIDNELSQEMKFDGNLDIFNNLTILLKYALRYLDETIGKICELMEQEKNAS